KSDIAGAGTLMEPRYIIEQPADFRGREIGVDDQPGAVPDEVRQTRGSPTLTQRRRPAILPDDRIVHRATGRTLPQNRGFALVGDADRGDRGLCRYKYLAACRYDTPPDLLGIVLDPSRSRVQLGQRDLRNAAGLPRIVEQDCTGARRALVDCQDKSLAAHEPIPWRCGG